jgi:regulator of PEP synthase PpsR (kinase-PPPase family)
VGKLSVYIVSDSIGETGAKVVKAALSQFKIDDYEIKRFSYVLDIDSLNKILEEISKEKNPILIHTLVDKDIIEYINRRTKELKLIAIDLLNPLMGAIQEATKLEPIREPGINRRIDEEYFKRVEAIEFAVKYDDGKDPRGILKSDVVIIGISRTSKTPLSMYLANKNIKVANVPLVPEAELPKEIYEISRKRIIGLTNSPIKLNEIREARMRALGLPRNTNYASLERILYEIDFAEKIMKKIGCPIIDVSNKAIEETAEIIITHLKRSGVKIAQD